MIRHSLIAVAALILAGCQQAPAAPTPAKGPHAGHDMSAMGNAKVPQNDAQKAYAAVNDRMHQGMADIPADADVAFMQGMLAHHKGAVEMSEVALKYGKDAKVRDLATRIIKAQQSEIAEMQGWLDARAKGASSDTAKAPAVADPHAGH